MASYLAAFNGALTLAENGFNFIGYFPKSSYPRLHAWSVTWRRHCGIGQIVTGLALAAFGYLADYAFPSLAKKSYLSIPLQMVCVGLLYANHGVLNVVRSQVERINLPGLTLAYDFYGKKALPAMNPSWDLQTKLFDQIKCQMSRIHFLTFFPPEICCSSK